MMTQADKHLDLYIKELETEISLKEKLAIDLKWQIAGMKKKLEKAKKLYELQGEISKPEA